jgi:uncharacterized membrane protein
MQHVVGVFKTRADAEAAVTRLRNLGFDELSVSVAVPEAGDPEPADVATAATHLTEENAAVGAISGAAVGTIVGVLVAASTIALPGLGTLLVGGPLAAALAGAGVGAASGGLIGALTGSGIPEADAKEYALQVEAGNAIVVVHSDENRAGDVRAVFDEENARRSYSM